MKRIEIETHGIVDWNSFHDVFADRFGFPDFYGRNTNAWIDCMTSLDQPEDGMSAVHVERGDVLVLELKGDVDAFAKRCPEQYGALLELTAFVNFRRLENDEPAVLTLSFHR